MTFPSDTDGVLGNTALDAPFDAIIAGSGAGGSAAAHVLAAAGMKVLILEAGDNHFPGLDRPGLIPWPAYSNDEIKMGARDFDFQDPIVEPRTFRIAADREAKANPDVNRLTRNVGGAAVISSVSFPRFTEVDFHMDSALRDAGRDFPGTSFADWPLDYAELEPFYQEAELLSGVAGLAAGDEADPFMSWRSGPFPLPPQAPMYVGRVLANGAAQLGYHPFNYPSAILTRPDDRYPDRVPCVSCGFCAGFGCPRNAKGAPAVTTLRRALLTGNCQLRYNAHVTRVLLAGSEATGVEYIDAGGARQSVRGDRVILAASAIESVRLCLLSGGAAAASAQLGRHMLFHFQTTGVGIFKQELHGDRGRSVTHGISDFRGIVEGGAGLRPDLPLGGVVEFGTSSEPIRAARESLRPEAIGFARLTGLSLKQLLVESPFHRHIAVLIMQGEDAPQASNRVDLDPALRDVFGLPVPRLTYSNHRFELDASAVYKEKMLELLEAAGAAFGFVQPFDSAVPPQSRHVLGGLRLGRDPAESVCDPWGRLHGLANLYCADGGVFVTSSGYNPTLTLIALALRIAGEIVSPGSAERVLAA